MTVGSEISETRFIAGVSIVVPTYREAENIPHLLARIDMMRREHELTLEVIFVDDDSGDGSLEAVEAAGFDWARMIVRKQARGLSSAVLEGFRAARYPVLVCMDCDLSHPPEAIPQMLLMLNAGQKFVIGSRYVSGGSTDDDWGVLRWFNSLLATILARPLTSVSDPMSGFFALRKVDFEAVRDLNPIGYKIALELIVKGDFDNVAEVPIHFSDRLHGESKLNFTEQLRYIQHLRRLYLYRFANAMHLAQFLVVGTSGVVVNLAVLTLLMFLGLPDAVCLGGGIGVSVVTNFILNRRFTFSYARGNSISSQFLGYLGTCAFGAAISFAVSLALRVQYFDNLSYGLQLASLFGIAAGMSFNYLGNRYVVFRKTHIRR